MKSKKIEEMKTEEIEEAINEYKQNLVQVESILELERQKNPQLQNTSASNTTQVNDLIKLQKDLKNAISFHEEVLKFKLTSDKDVFNTLPLNSTHVGRICSAYYEGEQKWYTAMINSINEEDRSCEITWLGYKEKQVLPWTYIKVQEPVNHKDLEVGMQCDAIYYEDGKWYQAWIEMISEHGVHVKYSKYNDVEIVSFDSIRITPEQKLDFMKKKLEKQKDGKGEEGFSFKIPEHLKITPADNDQQRLLKRKRVKNLKNTHKQKFIEKISKEKQDEWVSFSQKINKTKIPGFTPMKKIGK